MASSSVAADWTVCMWISKACLSVDLADSVSQGGHGERPRRDSDTPIFSRAPFKLASRSRSCGSSLACDQVGIEKKNTEQGINGHNANVQESR